MRNAVSGMTKSDGTIKMPRTDEWDHSHCKIAETNGIPIGLIGDTWARWECTPRDGDFYSDPFDRKNWIFKLDGERTLHWWTEDAVALEDQARAAVKRWMSSVGPGIVPRSIVSSIKHKAVASSTGDMAVSSSMGESATSSSTGYMAASSSTGHMAASSSTGYKATSRSTGHMAVSSSTGNMAVSINTGDMAASSSTGEMATSSSTGHRSVSSSTGDKAASSSTGKEGAAVAVGRGSIARAGASGIIVIAERNECWSLIGWVVGVVGTDGIRPDVWYEAKDGKLVEVGDDDERVKQYAENMARVKREVRRDG